MPSSEVSKIAKDTLEVLRSICEAGENFISSRLNVREITLKATEKVDKHGLEKIVPERKMGRLILKERKTSA